jgi:exonuclease VII large subunit
MSKMTNESEHALRTRFRRARSLMVGKEPSKEDVDDSIVALTGRIYVITTWSLGKGEEDFRLVLEREKHKIKKTIRINVARHGSQAVSEAIRNNINEFEAGDIVAIVRGGGDTSDARFRPFNDEAAVKGVSDLRKNKRVIVVSGVGHASDRFLIDKAATFSQATPTDAAYKVGELLSPRE